VQTALLASVVRLLAAVEHLPDQSLAQVMTLTGAIPLATLEKEGHAATLARWISASSHPPI